MSGPTKDEVRLPISEYTRHLRLLSAYGKLEDEVASTVSRYSGFIESAGLEDGLRDIQKARQEIHANISRRYGWGD